MTCHDAREKLSALRRGMDLTERALVHAHVMQCAECRKEREQQLEPVASSPTVAAQAALTVAEVARAGVARTAGLLTQVEHVRSGLTPAVHKLIQLRSPLMTVARATTDFARAGVPRVLDVLARLRVLLSIALTVSGQAAMRVGEVVRAGVARIMALSTRVGRQLPGLFVGAGRTAATLIGHARFGIVRVSREVVRAGVAPIVARSSRVGRQLPGLFVVAGRAAATLIGHARFGIVRVSREVVRAGVAPIVALSSRVGRQLPGLFVVAGRAAATLIGHARFGIMRVSRLLIGGCSSWMSAFPRAGRTTTEAARAGVTRVFELPTQLIAAGRALSVRAAQASPPGPKKAIAWPVRSLLSAGTGMVGLVILVAAIALSAGERLSRDVRLPLDPEPSFAETSAPIPVAAAQPAPVEASPPVPRPVRVRPRSPEPAQAAAALTPPTEATAQNADAADPTAAIDWLLQGGRRRQTQSP